MKILLTGGAGYIGSHVALSLLRAGHAPVILDNFSNSSPEVSARMDEAAGQPIKTIRGDVRDGDLLRSVLGSEQIEAVVHLAGLKSVANSVADPLTYHANNVGGMLTLLGAMDATGVRRIVFSSSATVYGLPKHLPIDEGHPTAAVNPYGQSKLICENILSDLARSDAQWQVSLLRYFNPVGADSSGLIGEEPTGIPNNLMPMVLLVALGKRAQLDVFGNDYPTADGTAVRDYIHVVDLAEGHVSALGALSDAEPLQIYNLGTGQGTSVLELVAAFEQATGVKVPYSIKPRRPGDVPTIYAASERAELRLGWHAKRNLAEMCADSWRYATKSNARESA
jgi:UDP-glucose 4-epimerase